MSPGGLADLTAEKLLSEPALFIELVSVEQMTAMVRYSYVPTLDEVLRVDPRFREAFLALAPAVLGIPRGFLEVDFYIRKIMPYDPTRVSEDAVRVYFETLRQLEALDTRK